MIDLDKTFEKYGVKILTKNQLEAEAALRSKTYLEPTGGNLYRPHMLMVTSGEFWRCAHGRTGLDTMGTPCEPCAVDDPIAYEKWSKSG